MNPVSEEMVAFYQELEEELKRLATGVPVFALTEEEMRKFWALKVPLLLGVGIPLEPRTVEQILTAVWQFFYRQRVGLRGELEKIKEKLTRIAVEEMAEGIKKFIERDFAVLEKICADAEEKDLCCLLLYYAARACCFGLARVVRGVVGWEEWQENFCPVCGWGPGLAVTGREGQRRLQCSLCGTEWEYKNLRCPFCSNEDHRNFQYFSLPGEEKYQVCVCEKCKRYVKIVSAREGGKVRPLVDDVLSLPLEFYLETQGYRKGERIPVTVSH